MHASVLQWIPKALGCSDVAGRRVLEVGSYNVNGSVRPLVEAHHPAAYVGVDQSAGPGVDQVVACADLVAAFGRGAFDVVISTEMLEHVVDWQPCVTSMVDVLAPGGLWVVTTRGPGFPYHPFPIDTWRYTVDAMTDIVERAGLDAVTVVRDPQVPGVFAKASKPAGWLCPWEGERDVFEGVRVEAMVP